ncbi:FecR family protein [Pedobacter cryoconitis]|uniref:Ferric-dicitrate binding protein FerR (Iron transport regulator) n=1 Tax=Pedobacter cryoconitis TaxID=188932 RepID=A0A7X0MIP1_9SPHI|nr:FecR family protein [Pedobacter cryoconitis]MBB6498755.1 ferric-dicitrate binding protein FerR (iron transport regulator) [Pedobacter cryoconitis]
MNEEQAEELIRKYNEGSASKEEMRLVENWFVNQSEIQQRAPVDLDYQSIKLSMWLNVDRRIGHTLKKVSFNFRIAAAAAVILLISVTVALFHFSHRNEIESQVVKNDVKPGQNKAVLTLADGRKISLTDATNGDVAAQAGVRISKDANGQLIYHLTGTSSGKSIQKYNTLEVPRGGQWQVILPDSSKVFLNALTSLRYPVTFSTKERRVELNGEAYFEITHHKESPFRVVTSGQVVEVLGTHFNINAYTDEPDVKTTLLEGRVNVNGIILKPNQQSVLSPDHQLSIINVDAANVVAWKEGLFKFDHTDIKTLMRQISRWYNVEVVYEGAVNNEQFFGKIERSYSLSEVLKVLELGKVHFRLEGRTIIVTP